MSSPTKQKAFTLIELLVVIAIIALLASIVLVALSSARAKARDATREGDLKQMSSALELYYASNNSYPPAGTSDTDNWIGQAGGDTSSSWMTGLSAYMAALPADPDIQAGYSAGFNYWSNGTDYILIDGSMENCSAIPVAFQNPNDSSDCTAMIFTPGAASYLSGLGSPVAQYVVHIENP